MALIDKLKAIGDAIRAKTGGTEELTLDQMVTEIAGIQGGGATDEEWFEDGNTHIWITLQEGRTSPMLGCCPNGTVTVDWGDGTAPDTLSGTNVLTVKWTPNHEYAAPGDYVITLTVDGTMGFYGSISTNTYSSILHYASGADARNQAYLSSVRRLEIGNNVTYIGDNTFYNCYSLSSVIIPDGVTPIGSNAFAGCKSLSSVIIPDGVTSIGKSAFSSCPSLSSVVIPDGVTSIGSYAFSNCSSLASVVIPGGVTSIGDSAFYYCSSLASVVIPGSVTSIGTSAFSYCSSLASVVIPGSVTSIGKSAFSYCYGVRYYDFTKCSKVPPLSNTNAFTGIAVDCQMLIPAALYDEWSAATNWTTYASYMVAV